MNVLEASNKLFEWFSENDSVNVERDFLKILPEEKKSTENVACLSAALQDFEKSELVKCNNDYWILKKPFSSFEQSVKISPQLALSIAHLVNGFCEVVGNDLDTIILPDSDTGVSSTEIDTDGLGHVDGSKPFAGEGGAR